MSDAFYNGLIAKVLPVLERFGTDFKIRSKGGYDPTTRETAPYTNERTAKGVVIDGFTASELGSDVGGANRGGAFIIGHKTLILEPSADLLETDEVLVDGIWFSASRMQPVKPANIVVIYMVTLGG